MYKKRDQSRLQACAIDGVGLDPHPRGGGRGRGGGKWRSFGGHPHNVDFDELEDALLGRNIETLLSDDGEPVVGFDDDVDVAVQVVVEEDEPNPEEHRLGGVEPRPGAIADVLPVIKLAAGGQDAEDLFEGLIDVLGGAEDQGGHHDVDVLVFDTLHVLDGADDVHLHFDAGELLPRLAEERLEESVALHHRHLVLGAEELEVGVGGAGADFQDADQTAAP